MAVPRPRDRSSLFLDVDGSLIDIAPRPEAVVVPASLVEDLRRTEAALEGAVALVSGRSISQLDVLFYPLRLRASGVHGAEMRLDPGAPLDPAAAETIPPAVRDDLGAMLSAFPGAFLEDKRYSLAVHFRAVPETGPRLRQALGALVSRHADAGLTLMPGHFVVELKRPSFDKGSAVRRFMALPPFRGRTPIFIGDDITDHPGFAAAVAAGGFAYGVGQQIPGTSGTFDSPSAVRAWLSAIAPTESMSE